MTEKEALKQRLDKQYEYIKSLQKRDFSTPDRRIELTNSAYDVLFRLQRELQEMEENEPMPLWEYLAGALVLSAGFALILYLFGAFVAWSWDFNETGAEIYRLVVGVFGVVMIVRAFFDWSKEPEE